ncbi:MAG: magnesium/cobalt transporter CorA [Planctomycetes bacterium]|nr:magnesium/cobalt transporter CorA [Planctomycetota bacterium]
MSQKELPPKNPLPKSENGPVDTLLRGVSRGGEDVAHLAKDAVEIAVKQAKGAVGRILSAAISLPGLPRFTSSQDQPPPPGSAPGIENAPDVNTPPASGQVNYSLVRYGSGKAQHTLFTSLEELLAASNEDNGEVRWISVNGLHPYVVDQMRRHFGFHSLAAEDVIHGPQRPKIENYGEHLFIVARMLHRVENELRAEQVSIFMMGKTVITFQEGNTDSWEPIRARIRQPESRFHSHDQGYLVYALLDAAVDHGFPILEQYSEALDSLDHVVLQDPTPAALSRIHAIKRDLSLLRRVMWPMRDAVDTLYRNEKGFFSPPVCTFLRDVHDHAVQIIDIIETQREMAGGLTDLYMSAASNRMNEIMKVLTIMSSIFIPITFLCGVYGMNLQDIPETSWRWAYPAFWCICLSVSAGLLIYFRRRGWIGEGEKNSQ